MKVCLLTKRFNAEPAAINEKFEVLLGYREGIKLKQ